MRYCVYGSMRQGPVTLSNTETWQPRVLELCLIEDQGALVMTSGTWSCSRYPDHILPPRNVMPEELGSLVL